MQDSIYQQLNSLSHKVDSLAKNIEHLSDKSTLSLWSPIVAALITVIIGTLIAQSIDRYIKNKRDVEKDLREIHSKCINAKIKLKDLFRELAMHKFHARYWWHIHAKEADKDFSNKYYLEHLRAQSEARETQKEIGQVTAEFLAEIVKFERLKGKKFNVDTEKISIENITFQKAKAYSGDISAKELREELAEQDEKELKESYFLNLTIFQSILDKMI